MRFECVNVGYGFAESFDNLNDAKNYMEKLGYIFSGITAESECYEQEILYYLPSEMKGATDQEINEYISDGAYAPQIFPRAETREESVFGGIYA